jgi:hypothetical protein
MTPRISPRNPPRRPASSLEQYRQDGDYAPIETRAFWRWATTSMEGAHASDLMPEEEYRVLSKAARGEGFSFLTMSPRWLSAPPVLLPRSRS